MRKYSMVVLCLSVFISAFLSLPLHSLAVNSESESGEIDCSAEPLKGEAAELEQLSEEAVEATRAGIAGRRWARF